SRNQDSSRKIVNVEDTSSKAIMVIDGAGFDWSYMADDKAPTNMAFMAFSDSKASKSVCVDTSNEIKKAPDAPIIKDWVSVSDEDESEGNKVTSVVGTQGINVVKSSACWFGDLKLRYKIMSQKTVDHTFGDLQDALKIKDILIVDVPGK
nr:hypothetical protein [Tanacetum cinerariifolium]